MDTPIVPPVKRCSKCGEEKPATLEFFYSNKGGLRADCKVCRKAYEASVADKTSKRSHERYLKKRDVILAASRAWKAANREKASTRSRVWREENLEDVAKKGRAYRVENAARISEYHRKYRVENAGLIAERKKAWDAKNPNARAGVKHRRRAREKELPCTITSIEIGRAFDYFNNRCAVCERQLRDLFSDRHAALDHWIPINSPNCPGSTAGNMVPLCHGVGGCNNSKSDTLPQIWLERKFGKRKAKQILQRIAVYFEWIKQQE